MRVVIDTNVIVSALVTRSGNPARVVEAALAGEITPVMDSRTIAEARAVLARPAFATKHGIDPAWSQYVLDALEDSGIVLETVPTFGGSLPDESDRPFVEVALAAGATLVTGNARHFPAETGVVVLSPAEAVQRLLGG